MNLLLKILPILIFLNWLNPSISQENGILHVNNYDYKDYHAHEQNWDMVEGDNGVLYFGNTHGILEYDGVNWRLIELPNQSVVRVLAKDSKGKIYVGGVNEFGYLSANKKGELTYISLLDRKPNMTAVFNDIWNIKLLDDNVYFFSYKYIFKLENDHIKLIETEDHIWGAFSYNHEMYYHAWNKGLKRIQGDSVVNIPFGDFFKDKNIWTFIETKKHKILGIDRNKTFYTIDLSIKNPSSAADFIHQSHLEISKQLENIDVYSYIQFNDETFGFGTFSGFYHISKTGQLIHNLNSKLGLLNDIIWNLYQDSAGLLWLITDNGISKVNIDSKLSYWSKPQGIRNKPLDLLRIDSTLFIASYGGLQYLKNNQVINSDLIIDECMDFHIFKNPESPYQDKYLASSHGEGIIEFNKNKRNILFNIPVWIMQQSRKNTSLLYLGTSDGINILEFKNSKWQYLGKLSGIDADIRFIYEEGNGNIWLGSFLKGIFKIEPSENVLIPNKIIQYGLKDNLPSLKDIFAFKLQEKLFFGTSKGLYRFSENQNKFVPDSLFGITYCNGSKSISSLKKDSLGRIWIGGKEKGKAFFSVASLNPNGSYAVNNIPFSAMYEADVSLLYAEQDSTIWFGSPEGLYKFKGEVPHGPESYPCYIRKAIIKKDSIIYFGLKSHADGTSVANEVNLDFNLNIISFQFAAPFFFSEELTQYQTWLEGFEMEWSEWSNDSKIDYLNLKEGNYKFHVRAKNVYGRISTEDFFQFRIRPPWHRTWWAYALYGLLAIIFAWLLIRINSVRLKRQNELLKQTVKERTANILQQKEEIQDKVSELQVQSEELQVQSEELQTQSEELQIANDKLVETNATKDKFFSIISHDLRSPFSSILGFTDLLSAEYDSLDDTEKRQIINSLKKSSQSAYDLLANLLTWARTQTGGIEIIKEQLNLKELVETSTAPYKNTASKKNIEIITNIPPDTKLSIDRNTSMTFIANLVNNAIKFTPEGGTITINYHENEDHIELHIIDTGVGMTSEVIEKLFRIDENISTKGTNNEKGTGLGLILCKEFINKNGGDISVISEVGKGSEFIITLSK